MVRLTGWAVAFVWMISSLPATADEAKKSAEDKSTQDTSVDKRIAELEALVKQQQATIEELKKQKGSSSEETAALKKRIDELENLIKKLQEVIETLPKQPPEKPTETPSEPLPPAPMAPQTLNPDISVIGDFTLMRTSPVSARRRRPTPSKSRASLREAEIAFQQVVDPFGRADLFISFPDGESPELEEGYLTLTDPSVLHLPQWLLIKAGKMKLPFGKLNMTHLPNEGPQVDTPSALTNFFGEEGIAEFGVLASALLPTKHYTEVFAGRFNADNEQSFTGGKVNKGLYLAGVKSSFDLTEAANLEVGVTGLFGRNEGGRKTTLQSAHAVYRWRPLREGHSKSFTFWNEVFLSQRQEPTHTVHSYGYFSFAEHQLKRNLYVGGRYDWSKFPTDAGAHESAVSAYLTFFSSEFTRYRLQFKRTSLPGGAHRNDLFLQATFTIGVHRPHPF